MFFKHFFSRFKNPQVETVTFNGLECPNCWGQQEWGNEFRPFVANLEKDRTPLGKARKTFIRKFVNKYLPS